MTSSPSDSTNDDREVRIQQLVNESLESGNANEADIISAHPDLMPELAEQLRVGRLIKAAQADAQSKNDQTLSLETTGDDAAFTVPEQLTINRDRSVQTAPRYDMRGEIARGGMGAVLRVWDKSLRRFVAMKVILGQAEPRSLGSIPPADPEMISRFASEAQITGQLDHPGIVPVHELGIDAEGRAFFTMQIVTGHTLAQIFELANQGEQGWTGRRVLDVILRVCEAVAYAHDKKVVHRDLKPSNIMVGKFGEVYVMDWGLAKVLGQPERRDARLQVDPTTDLGSTNEDDTTPIRTMDGHVVGTPSYMAPEQARGEPHKVGTQADVYSIGAILYHFLTGHAPYVEPGKRTSPQMVLASVIDGPPRPLSDLDSDTEPELTKIVNKAMARDADLRYRNLLELVSDLRSYLDLGVIRARQSIRTSKLTRVLSAVLTIGLGACGLLLALGVFSPSTIALSINLPVVLNNEITVDSVPKWIGEVSPENIRVDLNLTPSSFPIRLVFLVVIALLTGFIYLLRSILRAARDGKPFDPDNVRRIRLVGIGIFAIGVFQFFAKPVIHFYFLRHLALGGGQVGMIMINPTSLLFNPWLIAAAIILVLAEVFRIGTELEKARFRPLGLREELGVPGAACG